MPEAHLEITGDASSALAAIAAVKAAIAGLTGKTVEINVKTSGAESALRNLGKAHEAAGGAARDHGRATERANESLREHEGVAGSASRAAHELGNAAARAARDMEGLGGSSRRLRDIGSGSAEAARGMRELGSGESMRELTSGLHSAGTSAGQLSRNMGELSRMTSEGTAQAGGFGSSMDRASQFMVGADGAATRTSRSMEALGSGAGRASSGMGDFSSSAGRASSAAHEAYPLIDGFNTRVMGSGTAGHAASSGMRELESGARSAGSSFGSIFGHIGAMGMVSDAMSSVGSAASSLGENASGAMRGIGIGALVATAGMGILTAATAAVGGIGVFEDIKHSGPMMAEARSGMRAFSHEFTAMSGATAAAGLGPMKGLAATVKDLGHELASVGVANVGHMLGSASQLVGATTDAVHKLEPAIGPSISAVTALGKAVIGAVGDSAPAITQFANAVTAASPAIQAGLTSAIKGSSDFGSALVQTVGEAAPSVGGLLALAGDTTKSAVTLGGQINATLDQATGTVRDPVTGLPTAMGQWGDSRIPSPNWGGGGPGPRGASGADTGFGTGAGAVPHAEGMHPGEFTGSSFGWHMPAGAPPIIPGQANDMSSVVSDMMGSGSAADTQPSKGAPGAGAVGEKTPPPPPPPPPPPSADKDISKDIAPRVGGGMGGVPMSPAQMDALGVSAQTTQGKLDSTKQSMQSFGSQASSSMSQVGSSSQVGASGVSQATQGMAHSMQAAAPEVQSAATQIPQAAAQGVQQSQGAMSAPMRHVVKTAVQESAPVAEAGGSTVGVAAGDGMGQGMTKTITSTLTIVKKWVERIIDAGATALGAQSPSRKFAILGASIPQGLVVGLQAEQSKAISATQAMVGQTIQGAHGELSRGQGPLNAAMSTALTPSPSATPSGDSSQTPSGGSPQGQYAQDWGRGYGVVGSPASDPRTQDQKDHQSAADQAKSKADAEAPRRAALGHLGYSDETIQKIMDREGTHKTRADALKTERDRLNTDAQTKAFGSANIDPITGLPMTHDTRAAQLRREGKEREKHARELTHTPDPYGLAPKTSVSPTLQLRTEQMKQEGQKIGSALPDGVKAGVDKNSEKAIEASKEMAARMIEQHKKKHGVSSPATVWAEVGANVSAGLAGGLASGVAASGIQGVASDRGLMVGYVFGISVVSGAASVLKKDLFQALSVPQIDSPQAKAWLGANSLMGPAGSGAQIWKSPLVSLGGGSGAQPAVPPIHLTLNLDGQPFKQLVINQQDILVEAITNALSTRRG